MPERLPRVLCDRPGLNPAPGHLDRSPCWYLLNRLPAPSVWTREREFRSSLSPRIQLRVKTDCWGWRPAARTRRNLCIFCPPPRAALFCHRGLEAWCGGPVSGMIVGGKEPPWGPGSSCDFWGSPPHSRHLLQPCGSTRAFMEIAVLGVFQRLLSGPQPFRKLLLTSPPPCKEANSFGKTGRSTLPPDTFLCWRGGLHLTYICAFCPPSSPEPASVCIVRREFPPAVSARP